MCEFMDRVGLVCQIYEASSKAAFYIAKELLVCNNRLRCNHPLIVLLFSNHHSVTTSLCNDYDLLLSKHIHTHTGKHT